jgi:LAO/AO transport system kinase
LSTSPDHPLTQTIIREIRGVLSLVPQGAGKELMEKLGEHGAYIEEQGTLSERRRRNLRNEVLAIATGRIRRELEHRLERDESFQKPVDEVVSRRLDPASAASAILDEDAP